MELVLGERIDSYAKSKQLSIHRRLELIAACPKLLT
ncbi:MAG: hypothetical protein ACI841_004049 [Planctomycetota bacterium]|jgi:hypothetical protein